MFLEPYVFMILINTQEANTSRARFAYRTRITHFREFVLLGKLDGDYAPHTLRIHFLLFSTIDLLQKMCFGSLCRSAGSEHCSSPAGMNNDVTIKKWRIKFDTPLRRVDKLQIFKLYSRG